MADDLTYLLWFFVDLGQNSRANRLDLNNLAYEAGVLVRQLWAFYGGLAIIGGNSIVVGVLVFL